MTEPGPQASWSSVNEVAVEFAFAQQALYADLLVMGQHDANDPQAREVPPDLVSSTLVTSGKPALVLPYATELPDRFDTVAIAWKPTREAARAVCGAMPLLQRAGQVVVLSWGEEEQFITGSPLDLARFLSAHGVQARLQPQGPKETARIGEMLLSRACDVSADLLVMGCYGHSRGREWLLGGATRTVLESMTLPVLMAH
jgi:nucleotide-binding universal stress UspA family protein